MVLWKLFKLADKIYCLVPFLAQWLYVKLQSSFNKIISRTHCVPILNHFAAFYEEIIRAAALPQRCIIDGFGVKTCKNRVKTGRMLVPCNVVDAD